MLAVGAIHELPLHRVRYLRTVNYFLQFRFRHNPHNLLEELPPPEEEDGWNAANAVTSRRIRVFVHVQLEDVQLGCILGSDFVDDGGQGPAGAAPDGPKINDGREGRLKDLGIKILVGCGFYMGVHAMGLKEACDKVKLPFSFDAPAPMKQKKS